MSTFGEATSIVEAALTWHDAGCSLIPIRNDGTKRPRFDWADFQQEAAPRDTIRTWFHNPVWTESGIGVVCGAVSGNLEMLELEGRAATGDDIDKIMNECETVGIAELFTSLMTDGYAEWTPTGGLHFLYRIPDRAVPGNTKVARRPATPEELIDKPKDRIKVLAETRGEGGYVVVAPTTGNCHPTGEAWTVAAGAIGIIPTITWAQRELLVQAIHNALDEMPEAEVPKPRPALSSLLPARTDRPGDDFNTRAQWIDILGPHGWTISHHQGHTTYWVRPGKNKRDGHSATTGRAADGDRLYVFSSATEFTQETPYTKFAAYTLLEHRGDFTAASRQLRQMGFGSAATSSVAAPVPASNGLAESGWADKALDAAAAPPVQGTQVAVRDPDWLHAWAKPHIPADAFEFQEQSYAAGGRVYAKVYEDTFKYCGELKKWFFFNGTTWKQDKTEQFEQGVIELLLEAGKTARADDNTELAKWIRLMGRAPSPNLARWARSDPRIAVVREQFDKRRHLITLNNGVFDLDTATFTSGHDPKQLLTKQLHVTYDKDAKAPTWVKLLETLLPDRDIRSYLQRAVGHTLLGDAQERALFILHGDPGTGKSQVIKVLERMFGDFAETANATTFNEQSKRASITNDLNDLRGKRFVSVAELDENERLNEALVKRLTGGDTAKSRGLYQENSQWDVEFSLWMVTNFLPRLNSDDAAMWNRVKPIKFPVVVKSQGAEVKKIGEKIFAEEAAGVLNWMLEGVRMYQEQGLDDLPQITEAVATYRRDVDTVAQFMDAAVDEHLVVVADDASMPSRNLHTMYIDWCQRNGTRGLGERRFGQRMESLGYQRKKLAAANVWLGVGTGSYGVLGTMSRRQ